jgi:ribokinase
VGKLGDDAAGRELSDGLAAEGVEVRAKIVRGAASHSATILVDARGQRTVLWSEDERTRMTAADVDGALVCAGRVLHVDGEHPEAALQAAELARRDGRVVSCDLDRYEPETLRLLGEVDLAVVAPELALAATDERDPARAAQALARLAPRAALVVVTLGPEGAVAWDGEKTIRAPAFGGLTVVDTTACGDTFRAGLLAALIDGRPVAAALAFANAAAALKTRDLGRRGCPVRAEVEALLARRSATANGGG